MNSPAVPGVQSLLQRAQLLHDRATLEAAIVRMGEQLTRALAGERGVFLTVMNGGMFFAAPLAMAIDADLEFDYVHASRYGAATSGSEVRWRQRPTVPLAGRSVVLVDDILDEGYTLAAVRDDCVAAGARRVLIAVLCEKRHARRVPNLVADFVGVEVPDQYVFGYGLDYAGHGRNLPALYAVRDQGTV